MSTQAYVPASSAEGEVGIRMAGDVEPVSIVENQLVPVRGVEEDHDLIAGAHFGSRQRDVCCGRAAKVDDRRGPPEDLFYGAWRESCKITTPASPLFGRVPQREDPVRNRCTSGLDGCRDQKLEVAADLVLA